MWRVESPQSLVHRDIAINGDGVVGYTGDSKRATPVMGGQQDAVYIPSKQNDNITTLLHRCGRDGQTNRLLYDFALAVAALGLFG